MEVVMESSTFARLLASFLIVCSSSVLGVESSKGRDVYLSYCIACHAFSCNRDGAEAYSPKLSGLIGRKAGGLEDFSGYSEGLKNSETIWGDQTLSAFFMDPAVDFPDITLREYHKVGKLDEVKQLIAFLKTEDQSVDIFCTE